jgi:hypothetical protein
MVTLEDMYGNADMNLLALMYPTLEFYRDTEGVLKCRSKSGKKEEPAVGAEASSDK